MSRRGNCYDSTVTESFFQLLKRERIKKKIYATREEARSDIFDYSEIFYNSKSRQDSSEQVTPAEYENQNYQRIGSTLIIRGDSDTRWANPRHLSHFLVQSSNCTPTASGKLRVNLNSGLMKTTIDLLACLIPVSRCFPA